MKTKQGNSNRYSAHLFICTKSKTDGACCSQKGSEALLTELKEWARARWGKETVRINAAGCLGCCADGITAVLYPQNQWFTKLKSDDLPLLQRILREALKDD